MLMNTLPLVVLVLCAASAVNAESRGRAVWMPSEGKPVEVFIGPPSERSFVEVPRQVEHIEVAPGAIVEVFGEEKRLLHVGAREGARLGSRWEATLTLAGKKRLVLHLVARPQVMDARLSIRERTGVDPIQAARRARERLARCQSEEERVSGKARLIAERGSEAVINRTLGGGSTFKQTSQLSAAFVDVVHDVGISYVTLVIENRSNFPWPVALEKIKLGSVEGGDVRLIARASELATVRPKKKTRVVLAYETPADPAALVVSLSKGGEEGYSLFVTVLP